MWDAEPTPTAASDSVVFILQMPSLCPLLGMTSTRLVLLQIAALLARVATLDSQPEHDGFTTYCWKVKESPLAKDVNESMKLVESKDRGCPIQLRLETRTTSGDGDRVVQVLEPLRVQWTALAVFDLTATSPNALNLTQLYTMATPQSSSAVQIVHSNLHACEYGPRTCTPFYRGVNPTDNTANHEANFTAGRAQFEEPDLRFSKPGQYSLVAHVVLPGEVSPIRYDFVVYLKVVVKDGGGGTSPPVTPASGGAPLALSTDASSNSTLNDISSCRNDSTTCQKV
ncbi:hypothetical protein H310_07584 [Aphanomyces invadans]|uniref:Uncharacterized protein n=1 Tax=Aphanomyces invadans TaxID=157072 RepID=A0A024U1Q1_9STRA|nr:hypothetical protein H310_07584 [Aphanomyces invadans]ETW00184.1 hypothetical protein H310_07584 [Aphanomyces invadans]|eukprot:XP_008871209.1 hypothetical protein H310_07584 [Aphanomyces invadans]